MRTKLSFDEQMRILQNPARPNTEIVINKLFPDLIELHGDRLYGDAPAVKGGIATFDNRAVTVIGQVKGRNLQENIRCNFSMCHPEGFRKHLRLVKQAEKFGRPIICLVDTLGAYPGQEAEERGHSSAIAHCLMELLEIAVPIISIVLGSASSGGALAFMIADEIAMLENSVLSVIFPKGAAEILWKDSSRQEAAAALLKITAKEVRDMSIIDDVISEPEEGAYADVNNMVLDIGSYISSMLKKYRGKSAMSFS